jgi:hypothetical protein
MFLETLYQIIYKLGKIDKLPNMPDVLKTINELSILHNDVYQILKTTPDEKECIDKLQKLKVVNHTEPVFSKERVLEIIKNKKKIMEPFDTVFYHRTNKTAPSKLHLVQGGSYSKKRGRSVSRISRIRRTQQTYRKSLKRGGSSGPVANAETDAANAETDAAIVSTNDGDVSANDGDADVSANDGDAVVSANANDAVVSANANDAIVSTNDGDANASNNSVPKLDLTEQISALEKEIKELGTKKQDTENKQRDLEELQFIQELQGIMAKETDIKKPAIKAQILDILTKIHDIQEQRKPLGCLKKDFEEGKGIWGYIPDFMRPNEETGGKFKEYMDMFIETKDSIIGTAKTIAEGLGIDSVCKLINPKVEAKDWVLYPMWSLEQTLYFGEGISVQLDFLSLIVSQLDALYKLGAMSMSGAKMGIIQSALTGLAASTGGVAIAAAPVLGPAMGVAYDIGVYLFANMANIINMFIMISRKKHDGAFTLLTDIIPGMATTLNKAVNFLSILTSLSGKTINLLDNFTALLDSSFLKERFKDVDGPTKVLPVVGELVREKVELHLFVEANMLESNFEITDEMTYSFVKPKEGTMVELDPDIKAVYIIDKELYPCMLLDTRDNIIFVGKYYNERFVSSIKRKNEPGSPWIEEYNNIFIGNSKEQPIYKRKIGDYNKLKDCNYRLFVKDNSIKGSVFYDSYKDKGSKAVERFIRTNDESKDDNDKYKKDEAELIKRLETLIATVNPESSSALEPPTPAPLAAVDSEAPLSNPDAAIKQASPRRPPPQRPPSPAPLAAVDSEAPLAAAIEPAPTPLANTAEAAIEQASPPRRPPPKSSGGYRFKSKTRSTKNKKKSLKHKKLNQYSRKYMYKKRRNVSLHNH